MEDDPQREGDGNDVIGGDRQAKDESAVDRTVRSIRRATIGIIAASDNSAMIALSDRMARRFNRVGKVPGSRMENSRIRPNIRITSP